MTQLLDLKPKWEMIDETQHLSFDCPRCRMTRILVNPETYPLVGDYFEELSLEGVYFMHQYLSAECKGRAMISVGNVYIT